eukprot:gene23994-29112_t
MLAFCIAFAFHLHSPGEGSIDEAAERRCAVAKRCPLRTSDENLKYSVSEAIDALPRMQYGLNVNIRFNDVEGFEYMSDSTVFDVLGIRLLHGWLLDANDEETLRVIGNSAYNQLAERLVEASENEQQ